MKRETDRQTDRQTDRLTDRDTERQRERERLIVGICSVPVNLSECLYRLCCRHDERATSEITRDVGGVIHTEK